MDVRYTLHSIHFQWHSDKALSNLRKHGVSFETACEVFFDPFLQPSDDEYVDGEVRERVIGMTVNWQLLYVVYTLREDAIRLVSARPVTRQERKEYENQ